MNTVTKNRKTRDPDPLTIGGRTFGGALPRWKALLAEEPGEDAEIQYVQRRAAASVVEDIGGNEHRLEELWAEGTTVLVFLRHFG